MNFRLLGSQDIVRLEMIYLYAEKGCAECKDLSRVQAVSTLSSADQGCEDCKWDCSDTSAQQIKVAKTANETVLILLFGHGHRDNHGIDRRDCEHLFSFGAQNDPRSMSWGERTGLPLGYFPLPGLDGQIWGWDTWNGLERSVRAQWELGRLGNKTWHCIQEIL